MKQTLKSIYASQQLNIAQECLARHASGDKSQQTAMIFVQSDLSSKSFSYAELDALSAKFAACLMSQGLVPGDRVLLRLPNTEIFPIAFFAALRAGCIPVPSSPMLTGPEFEYLLKDSAAKAIVSETSLYAPVRQQIKSVTVKAVFISGAAESGEFSFDAEISAARPLPKVHASRGEDPAYLVYTSGTTGYPKGVLHAHQALMGRLPAATEWFNFKEGKNGETRILHSGKFNWTYVLGTAMMDPLYHGKTVVVYEGENSPERWLELIRQFSCNVFIGVPTIYRQILQKTSADAASVPTLRHAMCAGEHLSDEVLGLWMQRFGFPIYEGLGMSECSYYISQRPGEPIKPNSAGKIQSNRPIDLLDADLQPVATGEEGMLCIRCDDPGLFIEYWNAPEANAQQFHGDWFLTGDYARRDEDGYIYFLGRRDDIIKSFGYRVSPFEIERVYRDLPLIDDVVAFAEHVTPEKTLIAMCVQMKAGKAFNAEEILNWGSERLASYKVPKKVYTLPAFPRSANGKVLRKQIPQALGITSSYRD